ISEDEGPAPTSTDVAGTRVIPAPITVTQPVAVYLMWLFLGVLAGSYALLYPVRPLMEMLSGGFPKWAQVAGAGAVAAFTLSLIERCKRDRMLVGFGLGGLAAILAGLSLYPDLLVDRAAQPGW